MYEHFRSFYEDVFPEFTTAGRVTQFKVSCAEISGHYILSLVALVQNSLIDSIYISLTHQEGQY